jgi:hypothetical protein
MLSAALAIFIVNSCFQYLGKTGSLHPSLFSTYSLLLVWITQYTFHFRYWAFQRSDSVLNAQFQKKRIWRALNSYQYLLTWSSPEDNSWIKKVPGSMLGTSLSYAPRESRVYSGSVPRNPVHSGRLNGKRRREAAALDWVDHLIL